jgi:hypothetical protein
MSPTNALAADGLAERDETERPAKKASRADRPAKEADSLSVTEKNRLVRPAEAARLRGTSTTTVRRQLRAVAVRLGDKSIAFRLRDVLQLPES